MTLRGCASGWQREDEHAACAERAIKQKRMEIGSERQQIDDDEAAEADNVAVDHSLAFGGGPIKDTVFETSSGADINDSGWIDGPADDRRRHQAYFLNRAASSEPFVASPSL